jgi:hypothetical protein
MKTYIFKQKYTKVIICIVATSVDDCITKFNAQVSHPDNWEQVKILDETHFSIWIYPDGIHSII